ncbi:CCD84 protein, partial [Rostratula benghalensis]|nr:CCD84 protein [Rostratula benghalensis]
MAVHYCDLCRRTSFSGRRHLYSTGHRRRLREALAELQETVAAARAAAAAGGEAALRPYEPAERERRVWPEHRRETARFWREQRAEAALRERVLVPAEEYERFALGLERALEEHRRREEERIQQVPPAPARRRRGPRPGPTAPSLRRWPPASGRPSAGSGRRDTSQDAEQPGPSGKQSGPDLNWMESGQALTFIGHQVGATQTGPKPPWLMEEEEEGSTQEIGPSYEEFLKQKEKQKLKKLPAERVGANFDHSCLTSETWLPSFGRVWNHGRRWQSR